MNCDFHKLLNRKMTSSDEGEPLEIKSDEDADEKITVITDPDTICTICHAEFLDPDDLHIHITQVHTKPSSAVKNCQLCPEKLSDMIEYAEHMRDIHIKALKMCTYCWRIFEDFDEHRKHQKKHIKTKDNTYSCSQCELFYEDLNLLKKHEYEQHSHCEGVMLHAVLPYLSAVLKVKSVTFIGAQCLDVVYICVGCKFSTVDVETYIRHTKSKSCQVFVCDKCGNVFNQKKQISRHLTSNCSIFGGRERKSRLCVDCKTYIPLRNYLKHKNHCRTIKCFVCDIVFENMNDWSEHQSKNHAGTAIEVETCKFCWKRCVGKTAMKKHIDNIHRPEFHLYKYQCIYCKNIFKHPQKLFAHFFTKHRDVFPYTCKICNKTFRVRKAFTVHIKMNHDSVGFVEFDENYHVFFTDKKSENPFIPKSLCIEGMQDGEEKNLRNYSKAAVTETEGIETEVELKEKLKLKRKRTSRRRKTDMNIETSDDNEPLLSIRKKVRLQNKISTSTTKKSNKDLLTCKVCNKYCYTYQNYTHHVSLHSKHEMKKCIKCSKIFKSKSKLNEHIVKDHSSSKLTETLKTLLEKRKTGGSLTDDLSNSEKFRRTIKRAKLETTASSAVITSVDEKLSVQKFLENFVPEENKTDILENTSSTIKIVRGYPKRPVIKMTEFKPSPISNSSKLAMPVKFVDKFPEKVNISVKLVEVPDEIEDNNYSGYNNDSADMDTYESIPEVAEEVMLEGTDEDRKLVQDDIQDSSQTDAAPKILIPKLPPGMKDITIAHLLPQAPYYKIVKFKSGLDPQKDIETVVDLNNDETDVPQSIKLPDGTKLVTTNPLAHLLGNKKDIVLESFKNKYYKTKNKNFKGLLAQALQRLDKPSIKKKKKDIVVKEEA